MGVLQLHVVQAVEMDFKHRNFDLFSRTEKVQGRRLNNGVSRVTGNTGIFYLA